MVQSMDIGNRVKDLRIKKGLTQEELADRAELSKGFISQLERDLVFKSSQIDIADAPSCVSFVEW